MLYLPNQPFADDHLAPDQGLLVHDDFFLDNWHAHRLTRLHLAQAVAQGLYQRISGNRAWPIEGLALDAHAFEKELLTLDRYLDGDGLVDDPLADQNLARRDGPGMCLIA